MKTIRMLFAFLIVAGLLLSFPGCAPAEQPATDHTNNYSVSYPWTKGESPIPAERTGILRRFSLVAKNYEFTNTGIYYLDNSGFLMYADHGSDTFVMLCNRPNCPHADQPVIDWVNCNASFIGNSLCYYDGYLYVFGSDAIQRCNLDGTNHETVLSLEEMLGAYSGYSMPCLWNGILTFWLKQVDENGNDAGAYYYYKLDGSMKKPELCNPPLPYVNHQNAFIGQTVSEDQQWSYLLWDLETNTTTYLTDDVGFGYYGKEEAFVLQGSSVYKYVYADKSFTPLLDTGLEGELYLYCFPDCIAVLQKADEEYTLHLYNWAYTFLGSVTLDYEKGKLQNMPTALICGETHERIILAAGQLGAPRYYIEKSEFGTGNIQIYKYNLPFLPPF